jgi:glutaminyl-peptide cyclotransferase
MFFGIPLINQETSNHQSSLFVATSQTLNFGFNYTRAYQHIQNQLDFGYRIPGTSASNLTKQYIISELYPIATIIQHDYSVLGVPCTNIITKINEGKGPIIVFGAHFDSRAVAEKDPNPSVRSLPTPGANDGAGSVAVLIELLKVISNNASQLNYEVWGVFFDAEDQGSGGIAGWNWIEGSVKMVQDMKDDPEFFFGFGSGKRLEDIHKFILLDMVCGKNLKLIYEGYSNRTLLQSIFDTATRLGYSSIIPTDTRSYSITDDHTPFAQNGIVTADLIIKFWDTGAGWPHHHTRQDTLENMDIESIKMIGYTLEAWISDYYILRRYSEQNSPETPSAINAYPSILLYTAVVITIIFKRINQRCKNNLNE